MNAIAINRVTEDGEKNVAVALEYGRPVLDASVRADGFKVPGRTITAAYASEKPALRDGPGADERYVILELEHGGDDARTLPREWVVKARLMPGYEVFQTKPLRYADGGVCAAPEGGARVSKMVNEEFDAFKLDTFRDGESGALIAYALYAPEPLEPGRAYPLVLYWHGGGEKGDNALKNLLCTQNAVAWAAEAEQRKHPCFILAPQCPMDGDWIDPDTYETTGVFDAVCRLVFKILREKPVDPRRVYCTGFSMGGMGAWESIKRYPRLFAATLVFAGQCNYEGLELVKDNNIWVFHGEDDDKAMPGNIDNLQTLENAGAQVARAVWDGSLRGEVSCELARRQIAEGKHILHTLYREGSVQGGWAHEFGWRPAITNEAVRDWLFSHENPNPSREPAAYRVSSEPVPVPIDLGVAGSEIRHLSAGNRHNLAALADGSVLAWGFNASGQAGNGRHGASSDQAEPVRVAGLEGIVQVAAGNDFSLALDANGSVYGWGGNLFGQLGEGGAMRLHPARIEGIRDVCAIGAGDNYALALKVDGSVWAWGSNVNGQLGNGTYRSSRAPVRVIDPADESGFLTGAVGIEAGVRTAVAVKADGTIRCWGDGEYGQIGKGLAMHGPGTTVPFKALDRSDPSGFLTNARLVAEGRCFTAVLKRDGSVYAWGLNRHGELGIGECAPDIGPDDPDFSPDFLTTVVHPRRLAALPVIQSVRAGMNHAIALAADGAVFSWGFGRLMSAGALGVEGLNGSSVPVRVVGLAGIRAICAGLNHNFAIGADGRVWGWGNANNFRLGPVKR